MFKEFRLREMNTQKDVCVPGNTLVGKCLQVHLPDHSSPCDFRWSSRGQFHSVSKRTWPMVTNGGLPVTKKLEKRVQKQFRSSVRNEKHSTESFWCYGGAGTP